MLKKEYLKKSKERFNTSKRRVFIGGFFWLLFSIIFYAFLIVVGKTFILFSAFFNDYEIIIIPEKSKNYYSFFLAFIAVFFSFSLLFNFIIDKPKKFFSKYNYKRNIIINQQRTVNWFFMNWFFRIATLFGILAIDYSTASFFTDNIYLIILLIIVFIGQIWMSIRCFIHKNKLKWFIVSVFSLLIFSFLISKIKVINNDEIDKSVLARNTLYKLDIKRVESNLYQHLPTHRALSFNIYIKQKEDKIITVSDFDKFLLGNTLRGKINKFKHRISEAEIPFISYILHIDKRVKMKHVLELKNMLKEEEGNNVYYSIYDKEKPFFYKSNKIFGFKLNLYEMQPNFIRISFLENNKYYFQNNVFSKEDLKRSLKNRINEEGISSFVLSFDENISFEEYFTILSLTREIVDEFRNNMALKGYNQGYNSLSKGLKEPIKNKYYWAFIDEVK